MLWFRGTLLTKLNVVCSLALFGSESKPEERGTSDEGASDEVRADLLDRRTVQVMNGTDQRDFYRNIIGLNRLLLRLIVQPKRSDPKGRPARFDLLGSKRLGFDCADGLVLLKKRSSPFVIIITIIKRVPRPLRSR